LLVLALFALPKLLWQRLRYGKYRSGWRQRLGLSFPPVAPGRLTIWIHAVSVGETRAVVPLFHALKKRYPEAAFVVSTTTETGQEEAKRSLPGSAAYLLLPLDFSWCIRRAVRAYRPHLLILVESDFWYHLLLSARNAGARIALVNGKLSARSCRRFVRFSWLARRIFTLFDVLCVQSALHAERFQAVGVREDKLRVTGNLKFDAPIDALSPQEKASWRHALGLAPQDGVVVVASTHHPEEVQLLKALEEVRAARPSLKVLLAPRHPERFSEVRALLPPPFLLYSERAQKTGAETTILIDAMGMLRILYQLADATIVGGSFTERIGGHNIFEPIACGAPVLFGPHMHQQNDLAELVLNAGAGIQTALQDLPGYLLGLLEDASVMRRRGEALAAQVKGSSERTFQQLVSLL
jgi:3-deoxy-D-manno-octulosonic-acid transferase